MTWRTDRRSTRRRSPGGLRCHSARTPCSSLHARHASRRARPGVFSTQTTRRVGWRATSISRELRSEVIHGGSSVRSTMSTTGQPARSSDRDGSRTLRPAQASAPSDGAGDTSRHAIPIRRARSTATSRACHVGLRSSWSASSCSSSTTITPHPVIGPQTAAPRTDDHVDTSAGRRPIAWQQRHRAAHRSHPGCEPLGGIDRCHHDEQWTVLPGLQEQRQRITRRRPADQPTAIGQERGEPVDDTRHLVAPPTPRCGRRDGSDGTMRARRWPGSVGPAPPSDARPTGRGRRPRAPVPRP